MIEEVPDSNIMLGDRVNVDDPLFGDEVYVAVFFPRLNQTDVVIQSEKSAICKVVPFHKLRRTDRPYAKLTGWAVAFADKHVEFWQHDPGFLYGEQVGRLGIVGVTPVEVPVVPFPTKP